MSRESKSSRPSSDAEAFKNESMRSLSQVGGSSARQAKARECVEKVLELEQTYAETTPYTENPQFQRSKFPDLRSCVENIFSLNASPPEIASSSSSKSSPTTSMPSKFTSTDFASWLDKTIMNGMSDFDLQTIHLKTFDEFSTQVIRCIKGIDFHECHLIYRVIEADLKHLRRDVHLEERGFRRKDNKKSACFRRESDRDFHSGTSIGRSFYPDVIPTSSVVNHARLEKLKLSLKKCEKLKEALGATMAYLRRLCAAEAILYTIRYMEWMLFVWKKNIPQFRKNSTGGSHRYGAFGDSFLLRLSSLLFPLLDEHLNDVLSTAPCKGWGQDRPLQVLPLPSKSFPAPLHPILSFEKWAFLELEQEEGETEKESHGNEDNDDVTEGVASAKINVAASSRDSEALVLRLFDLTLKFFSAFPFISTHSSYSLVESESFFLTHVLVLLKPDFFTLRSIIQQHLTEIEYEEKKGKQTHAGDHFQPRVYKVYGGETSAWRHGYHKKDSRRPDSSYRLLAFMRGVQRCLLCTLFEELAKRNVILPIAGASLQGGKKCDAFNGGEKVAFFHKVGKLLQLPSLYHAETLSIEDYNRRDSSMSKSKKKRLTTSSSTSSSDQSSSPVTPTVILWSDSKFVQTVLDHMDRIHLGVAHATKNQVKTHLLHLLSMEELQAEMQTPCGWDSKRNRLMMKKIPFVEKHYQYGPPLLAYNHRRLLEIMIVHWRIMAIRGMNHDVAGVVIGFMFERIQPRSKKFFQKLQLPRDVTTFHQRQQCLKERE